MRLREIRSSFVLWFVKTIQKCGKDGCIEDNQIDGITCRNRGSSLCLAVEADPGRAVPVPEARRAQPVSRPRQGRGTRYPRSEGRAVGPQWAQRASRLQRGHAHRQPCACPVRSVHLLHCNSVKRISPAIAPASAPFQILSLFSFLPLAQTNDRLIFHFDNSHRANFIPTFDNSNFR